MSELKWNWAYYPYLDPPEKQAESALKAGYIKVVNKDEADKVIAHNKYKRCLAMARWCKLDMEQWIEGSLRWQRRKNWHGRWLELAEQFKDKEAK